MTVKKEQGQPVNDQEVVDGGPYRVAAKVSEGIEDPKTIPGISTRIRYKVEDAYDWVAGKTGEYSYRILKATPVIGSVVGAVEWLGARLNGTSSMQWSPRVTRKEEREFSRMEDESDLDSDMD